MQFRKVKWFRCSNVFKVKAFKRNSSRVPSQRLQTPISSGVIERLMVFGNHLVDSIGDTPSSIKRLFACFLLVYPNSSKTHLVDYLNSFVCKCLQIETKGANKVATRIIMELARFPITPRDLLLHRPIPLQILPSDRCSFETFLFSSLWKAFGRVRTQICVNYSISFPATKISN